MEYRPSQIQSFLWESGNIDRQAYSTIKSLFDQTRGIYCEDTAIIDVVAMEFLRPTEQEVIRKANLVTSISSLLGFHDVSLFHLDKYFLDVFVPFGQQLLDWQSALLLQLKTQACMASWTDEDKALRSMLEDLFPHDLAARLSQRHPHTPDLSLLEKALVHRCESRKSRLLADPLSQQDLDQWRERYKWSDFAIDSVACIIKNIDDVIISQNSVGQEFAASADLSNESKVLSTYSLGIILPSQHLEQKTPPAKTQSATRDSCPDSALDPGRRVETRRLWTDLEENALLAGIASVDGPYWSRILALHGRGGSVSEALKDRNQVQLKDKARNMKLQYLKAGKEVPSCLQAVTGDLKTRGGNRVKLPLANEKGVP